MRVIQCDHCKGVITRRDVRYSIAVERWHDLSGSDEPVDETVHDLCMSCYGDIVTPLLVLLKGEAA